ncbi:SpdA2 protein [Streptomyces sp. SPB78]|nr:SpdA2 protein [Streptomyces sp. SPB78]
MRVDAVLVQAVIAGALSFAHIHDVADAAGQDGWKAWAYPISVDLLLVAAWRRLRISRGDRFFVDLVRDRAYCLARRQRRHRRSPRPRARPGLAAHPRRRVARARLPRRQPPHPPHHLGPRARPRTGARGPGPCFG